ncbi:Anti-repressor SinI [Halobacillus alkaliphilus]|uniref:Anti-repressor SinI n=1 Tax=Halobacillus alkaliphilus TaxID=396056 RepID=A0A1I2NK05_9BACI|nr:anti-repressor SinI family protein [Halobacillus alkaliphilus]SFG04315.1 Anti-repressor SinI [Halobacillus alkaliphilus]
MRTLPSISKLDEDWVHLLKQAKAMGLTIEEVRDYIKSSSNKRNSLE